MENCIFCRQKSDFTGIDLLNRVFKCTCKNCGGYLISEEAIDKLKSDEKIVTKVFAFLKQRQIRKQPPVFILLEKNEDEKKEIYPEYSHIIRITINEIINDFPKLISERIDRVLLNLRNISNYFGYPIHITEKDYPIFYSDSQKSESLLFMISQLGLKEYIRLPDMNQILNPLLPAVIYLSGKGWDRVIDLEDSKNFLSKRVFVAMAFDPSLNDIYENGIKKAVEELNFFSRRIDEKEYNEDICDEIIAEIKKSKFLICDLTRQRGGVYFEGGFGKGLSRNVIWTCKKDEIDQVHFDINHNNIILWKNKDDLYEKLKRRIEATVI